MKLKELLITFILVIIIPTPIFGELLGDSSVTINLQPETLIIQFIKNWRFFKLNIAVRSLDDNYQYFKESSYGVMNNGTIYLIEEKKCIPKLITGDSRSSGSGYIVLNLSNLKRGIKYYIRVTAADIDRSFGFFHHYSMTAASAVREMSCNEVTGSDSWTVTWSAPKYSGADIVQYRLLLAPVSSSCAPDHHVVQFDVSCISSKCYKSATSVGSNSMNECPDVQPTEYVNCSTISNNKIFKYIIPGSKLRVLTKYKVTLQLGTEWGWNQPVSSTFTTKQKITKPNSCLPKQMDFVTVVEYSENFLFTMDYAYMPIEIFPLGKDAFRVSHVTFSEEAKVEFNFNFSYNYLDIFDKFWEFKKIGAATCIGCGLREVTEKLIPQRRKNVPFVVVLITHGENNINPPSIKEAQKLKDAGAKIIVIGVGDKTNKKELKSIASKNSYFERTVKEIRFRNKVGSIKSAILCN